MAPIADTAVGGAAAVAATALALTPCDGDDRHNFCNGGKEIVAIATVVTGLVFAGSAAYGYVVAADCTRAPPSQLPPFSLATPTGRVIRTDELRGQIVVIDFWAGWCRPCIRAEPKLRDLAREFAEHRVTFVAVNIEAADVALPEYGGDDIVVLRDGGQLAQSAGITSLPSYLIYDRRGQLAARIGGTGRDHLAEIRAELEELIHER